MNNVWFISDTHFGHKNIIKYEAEKRPFNSIEEHDETLIENWNKCVKKNDTIWHLGDVAFGVYTLDRIMPRLNGNKRLVLGNHDCYAMETYVKYFDRIFGVVFFKEFILSHVPLHKNNTRVMCNLHGTLVYGPKDLGYFHKNLHGHLHSYNINEPGYFNCSVEQHNLSPVNLDVIREYFNEN